MTEQLARPRSLVGARVRRREDRRLLTGAGTFVDDLSLPGMLHAAVLRSPLPHARIAGADASRAEAPLVLTPADVARSTREVRCIWVLPGQRQTTYPVVADVARYVGEPLGLVVAETRAAAEDAAELVELDLDPLPALADPDQALAEGAPLLHADWGTNVVVEMEIGDPADAVEDVIAGAAHVVERRLRIQRVTHCPIEPRGAVAHWEAATGTLTLWSSTQSPHHLREMLAEVLTLPAESIRVIARDVGGGFGQKEHLYPEEVLVSLATMRLGAPVKWIEDRSESLLSAVQGRDHLHDARLALDADGRFLALHSRIVSNVGARPSNVGAGPALVSSGMLPGPYAFEAVGTTFRAVLTNRPPTGAYRGFGMQQAAWVRERLVDEAARELGVDPVELRLRNMLRPEQLPYLTRTSQQYDSGDYPRALERTAELMRAAPPRPDDGRRRGVGFASYVEFTGLGPTAANQAVGFHLSGYDTAVVRVETDGTLTIATGTSAQGQGHETTFAQLAADRLGVPLERVRVLAGDTATTPFGSAGAIASRSMTVAGGAIVRASERLRDKVLRVAANLLEASAADLVLADGEVRVRGAEWRSVPLADVASRAWLGWDLADGDSPGLEERDVHDPAGISYSYATHAAAVAVDPETGEVEVERYAVVHDCGTAVNPTVVEGQIEGGVAQGLGIALLEESAFDADGMPLCATLMDYLLPTSDTVPDIEVAHQESPSPFVPGGMKGVGEGGTIGAPAAIGNAVAAALPEIAEHITETPLSPARIWALLRETR
ncbi:MAG TPA: xanthine dehydrogenase family protein molybdopterin-binding subunit [Gaiellaceae bacterium]|nr:xanthine dehydrogenase family protein molybdopterin-binding subunit [Gaiellaceae bacterium]